MTSLRNIILRKIYNIGANGHTPFIPALYMAPPYVAPPVTTDIHGRPSQKSFANQHTPVLNRNDFHRSPRHVYIAPIKPNQA